MENKGYIAVKCVGGEFDGDYIAVRNNVGNTWTMVNNESGIRQDYRIDESVMASSHFTAIPCGKPYRA